MAIYFQWTNGINSLPIFCEKYESYYGLMNATEVYILYSFERNFDAKSWFCTNQNELDKINLLIK